MNFLGPFPNPEIKVLSPTECNTSIGDQTMSTMKACQVSFKYPPKHTFGMKTFNSIQKNIRFAINV